MSVGVGALIQLRSLFGEELPPDQKRLHSSLSLSSSACTVQVTSGARKEVFFNRRLGYSSALK